MNYSTLEHNPPVFTFRFKKDGAFMPDLIAETHAALDAVQNASGEVSLVVTGEEKSFSTGFDLDYASRATEDARQLLMEKAVELLERLLAFPLPTVAAINGHAFGMGAMVALACDYRYMRADRGYFCLPEIDLKVALPAGMMSLLKLKLAPPALRDLLLTGKRIGGEEAMRLGIVDEACAADEVLPNALSRASALAAQDRETYGAIKRSLNHL
jgi:enoyl-CoA hydratase/carnithine racemase